MCRPSEKGSGEEGILSDVVSVYLYCPAFSVSVSLGDCVTLPTLLMSAFVASCDDTMTSAGERGGDMGT